MIELIGDVDRALPERAIARWRAEARRCLRRRLQSPGCGSLTAPSSRLGISLVPASLLLA